MTAQFPLHPGDLRQLMQIRRYLIGYRKTNGWTQPELSQMINETTGMVWLLESDQTWQWRLSRLQGWCTPFGLRLDAKLQLDDDHMNQRVHRDAEVAPLYALSQDSSAWKKWQGMYLTSALSVARRKMGISMQEVADRLKVSARAIGNWEASASELMLAKALLYARALDGYVHLELVEEEERRREKVEVTAVINDTTVHKTYTCRQAIVTLLPQGRAVIALVDGSDEQGPVSYVQLRQAEMIIRRQLRS